MDFSQINFVLVHIELVLWPSNQLCAVVQMEQVAHTEPTNQPEQSRLQKYLYTVYSCAWMHPEVPSPDQSKNVNII